MSYFDDFIGARPELSRRHAIALVNHVGEAN